MRITEVIPSIARRDNQKHMLLIPTCAAYRSYAVFIEREAAADCQLTHVFVELVATSEIEQCAVELVAGQQSVNKSHYILHHETRAR